MFLITIVSWWEEMQPFALPILILSIVCGIIMSWWESGKVGKYKKYYRSDEANSEEKNKYYLEKYGKTHKQYIEDSIKNAETIDKYKKGLIDIKEYKKQFIKTKLRGFE